MAPYERLIGAAVLLLAATGAVVVGVLIWRLVS